MSVFNADFNNRKVVMNRRKQGIDIVKMRIKKAKAKLAPKNKPKYISKAKRAKLESESVENVVVEREELS